jgi:dihydropteridine reductase
MPDADQTTWTSLEFVSDTLFDWANGDKRPASGALVKLITKDGKTDLVVV